VGFICKVVGIRAAPDFNVAAGDFIALALPILMSPDQRVLLLAHRRGHATLARRWPAASLVAAADTGIVLRSMARCCWSGRRRGFDDAGARREPNIVPIARRLSFLSVVCVRPGQTADERCWRWRGNLPFISNRGGCRQPKTRPSASVKWWSGTVSRCRGPVSGKPEPVNTAGGSSAASTRCS
jgi:hypothetical protein